jgi:hypothetical protein
VSRIGAGSRRRATNSVIVVAKAMISIASLRDRRDG